MFTGLIEHLALLHARTPIDSSDGGFTLTFAQAAPILDDCSIGDSIAVNGACLTVTGFEKDGKEGGWFKVGLAPETLERTNLGTLQIGDYVACERAMAGHTRFGGHMVQGHVDTTATITSLTPDGNSLRITFRLPDTPLSQTLLPSLIPKGYVTIDGASLTLTSVPSLASTPTATTTIPASSTPGDVSGPAEDAKLSFSIMLIAHSQTKLVLGKKSVGDKVNIEVDSVGKFVEMAVRRAFEGTSGEGSGKNGGVGGLVEGMVERVVERVLREKGVLPKE